MGGEVSILTSKTGLHALEKMVGIVGDTIPNYTHH
jgi:hypothetical protein